MSRKLTTGEFIEKAKAFHGDKYDYSETEYKGATTKVILICPLHGRFTITPDSHTNGRVKSGCAKCKFEKLGNINRQSLSDFISKAVSKHGDKYDYSLIKKYIDSKTKYPIICPQHSVFYQAPNQHQQGQGCPLCMKSGYRKNKPGFLYVLTTGDETKIGITNRSPRDRQREINKASDKRFDVLHYIYFEDGTIPLVAETKILNWLRSNYEATQEDHDGFTETFVNVDNEKLITKIAEEVIILNTEK